MHSFVQGRSQSPLQPPQQSNIRVPAAQANNLKVAVPKTTLQPRPTSQGQQSNVGKAVNPQQTQRPVASSSRFRRTAPHPGSAFDTDYEESTTGFTEEIQVRDSQPHMQQDQYYNDGDEEYHEEGLVQYDDDGNELVSGESESEERSGDEDDEDEYEQQNEQLQAPQMMSNSQQYGNLLAQPQPQQSMFRTSGASYPPTTSGRPDEESEAEFVDVVGQSFPGQHNPQEYSMVTQPGHQAYQRPASTQLEARTAMPPPPTTPARQMPNPRHARYSIYDNPAAKRQPNRSEPNLPIRQDPEPAQQQAKKRPFSGGVQGPVPQNAERATYSELQNVQNLQQRSPAPTQGYGMATPSVTQMPQQGPARPVVYAQGPSGPRIQQQPGMRPDMVGAPTITPSTYEESDHGSPQNETNIDYSPDELASKSYEDLQLESFDYNPAAASIGLLEDVASADLPSRVSHVFQNVPADQHEDFFRSLPITEWEEAGDWFVSQFGDTVTKIMKMRQDKRKIARHFEQQVSERNDAVKRKKRKVDQALSDIQVGGEELLKTPGKRKSATPARGP